MNQSPKTRSLNYIQIHQRFFETRPIFWPDNPALFQLFHQTSRTIIADAQSLATSRWTHAWTLQDPPMPVQHLILFTFKKSSALFIARINLLLHRFSKDGRIIFSLRKSTIPLISSSETNAPCARTKFEVPGGIKAYPLCRSRILHHFHQELSDCRSLMPP